ncbi:MAG: ATP-binding cassette domain-containing protein [Nitriliruptoraceae bacterium]
MTGISPPIGIVRVIELEHVTKQYDRESAPAVDDLTVTFASRELTVLVGPSGCGKTTTLKMINRIIEPTAGSIRIDGADVLRRPPHELRREIGFVIQRVGLFPHRTVGENIATVPEMLGWDRARIRTRVYELLELMDLDAGLRDRYPAQLSGGQQQRVGVARALAADPPVLLMDEPFGAVDPIVRDRLQAQLLELQAQLQKTIVFVTHDVDEAILLGDRIAILATGGVIAQFDTPHAILRSPAGDFVRSFLGNERHLKRLATIAVRDADIVTGPVVKRSMTHDQVHAVGVSEGTDWAALVDDDGTLEGWVWLRDRSSADGFPEDAIHQFRVIVSPEQTLRSALDAIVANRNQVAAVIEDGKLLGMLFIENISRQLLP